MTATTTASSTATRTASKTKKTKRTEAKTTETKSTASAQSTARLFYDHVESPLGSFTVVADGDGRLVAAGWTDDATDGRMAGRLRIFASRCDAEFVRASNPGGLSAALAAYFAGDLAAIEKLPVSESAGTPFQRSVWRALRGIPCGESRSYGDIAREIGRPSAVRAVGLANGSNPICIVVPCHRVIGSNGKLVGYGGGVERKRWLLTHEKHAPLRG
jgi:methylated-DNA-[protein]-cysteine S-methyltransferase